MSRSARSRRSSTRARSRAGSSLTWRPDVSAADPDRVPATPAALELIAPLTELGALDAADQPKRIEVREPSAVSHIILPDPAADPKDPAARAANLDRLGQSLAVLLAGRRYRIEGMGDGTVHRVLGVLLAVAFAASPAVTGMVTRDDRSQKCHRRRRNIVARGAGPDRVAFPASQFLRQWSQSPRQSVASKWAESPCCQNASRAGLAADSRCRRSSCLRRRKF